MRILLDMNLSPHWVRVLEEGGHEAVHWSTIGDPRATDTQILQWARANHYIVFTHDLDFGAILAVTSSSGPSVLQVRAQNVLPEHLGALILTVLKEQRAAIERGALLVIDERALRVRVLPLERT